MEAAAAAAEPGVWKLVKVDFFLEGPTVFLQELERIGQEESEGCLVFWRRVDL